MRVLMLSWEYPPHLTGGLGNHVMELVPALTQQGIEIHLVTPRWAGGRAEEKSAGLPEHRVDPCGDEPAPEFYTRAWRTNARLEETAGTVCEQEHIDLIHNHDWLTAFSACALKRSFHIPLLTTIHATEQGRSRGHLSSDQQRAIHSAEWWLAYESWRVICCSQFMADEIATYFQTPADKIDVIPNGIRADRFERWEGIDLTRFRTMYALPEESIVFNVGRAVHEKGVHLLIEAAPLVLLEHPQAKFVIAGTGSALAELRRRAWEIGVGDKVLFTGFIPDDDRDRLYKVAACAVFPSLYEPFGIVALEAMAAKVPVVVSAVGGLQEVVSHAKTGVTAYPNSARSLAWGINHTLARPDWAAQRARQAYQIVQREYNWQSIAQRTIAIYERIAAERDKADW